MFIQCQFSDTYSEILQSTNAIVETLQAESVIVDSVIFDVRDWVEVGLKSVV